MDGVWVRKLRNLYRIHVSFFLNVHLLYKCVCALNYMKLKRIFSYACWDEWYATFMRIMHNIRMLRNTLNMLRIENRKELNVDCNKWHTAPRIWQRLIYKKKKINVRMSWNERTHTQLLYSSYMRFNVYWAGRRAHTHTHNAGSTMIDFI